MDVDDQFSRRGAHASALRAYLSRSGDAWRTEIELVSLSPDGATCGLEPGAPFASALGEPVTLWLVQPPGGAEHRVPARLVRRSDDPRRILLVLAFSDPASLAAVVHLSFAEASDHRVAIRVRLAAQAFIIPPRECGVPVQVADLHDLSVGGFAADVPVTFEQAVVGRSRMECLFRLPETVEQLPIAVSIRHRALLPDGRVRYGAMFAQTDDGRLEVVQLAVASWILKQFTP